TAPGPCTATAPRHRAKPRNRRAQAASPWGCAGTRRAGRGEAGPGAVRRWRALGTGRLRQAHRAAVPRIIGRSTRAAFGTSPCRTVVTSDGARVIAARVSRLGWQPIHEYKNTG